MTIEIKAKKDLYNDGKCFTKDKVYKVESSRRITNNYGLEELYTVNDQNERHRIGNWYREFEILDTPVGRKLKKSMSNQIGNHPGSRPGLVRIKTPFLCKDTNLRMTSIQTLFVLIPTALLPGGIMNGRSVLIWLFRYQWR